jgi:hypothetical protein
MVRWLLIAFAAGISVGVLASRQFSAAWVEAVGTWAAALATIATIIWAVRSFQEQARQRQEDIDREDAQRLKWEFDLARNVGVRCSGGSANGIVGGPGEPNTHSLNNVWIRLTNGTSEPVTIERFDLPGITFRGNVMRFLPSTLPGGETFRDTIDVEPIAVSQDEVSDRGPLKHSVPVLRYRIAGVTWERTGNRPPMRCD